MKKIFLIPKLQTLIPAVMLLLLSVNYTFAQSVKTTGKKTINVAMEPRSWDTTGVKTEFGMFDGYQSMKLVAGRKQAILKDQQFTDGTIEFDVQPLDAAHSPFVSFYFRWQSNTETECFYLRLGSPHPEKRNDAVQYSPFVKNAELWNLLDQYQGPANINYAGWNHVKLIISGKQFRAYINDMQHPCMQVPYLEGDTKQGVFAFDGRGAYANMVIKPGVTEDLPAVAGADLTDHDPYYIRHWQLGKPVMMPAGHEIGAADLPKDTATWAPISAERRGLINVSRVYGLLPNRANRYVWLKTNIHSDKDRVVSMQLGFLDDISMFINGKLLYQDKNTYFLPIHKNPDGRLDLANSTVRIPLKAGDNTVMVAISNYFYGWGIVARLENLDGIDLAGN